MPEITDEKLAEIRAASCSTLVQSLVERLDRVEGENESLRAALHFYAKGRHYIMNGAGGWHSERLRHDR